MSRERVKEALKGESRKSPSFPQQTREEREQFDRGYDEHYRSRGWVRKRVIWPNGLAVMEWKRI